METRTRYGCRRLTRRWLLAVSFELLLPSRRIGIRYLDLADELVED